MSKRGTPSPRQQDVLDILIARVRAGQPPPTLRELCTQMGVKSTNGMNDHLDALVRKGFIERDFMRARGIRVLDEEGVCTKCGQTIQPKAPGTSDAQG